MDSLWELIRKFVKHFKIAGFFIIEKYFSLQCLVLNKAYVRNLPSCFIAQSDKMLLHLFTYLFFNSLYVIYRNTYFGQNLENDNI